jgi:hypothetical protein
MNGKNWRGTSVMRLRSPDADSMRPVYPRIHIPRAQRGQLLIILVGFLFLGSAESVLILSGKTTKEVRKQFAALEPDTAKRQNVENVLALISQETKRLDSERSRLEKEAFKALERHDTTPEEFRALSARADAVNADSNKTLIDLRFMLRRQVSDSQWTAIVAPASPTAAR